MTGENAGRGDRAPKRSNPGSGPDRNRGNATVRTPLPGEASPLPAESKSQGMRGSSLHGNRETRPASTPLAGGKGIVPAKVKSRRTGAYAGRESDEVIVPEKQPNKETPVSAEAAEGRTSVKGNAGEEAALQAQSCERASFGLKGVLKRARAEKSCRFTNLTHHITPELLRDSFYRLKRKAAPGIDEMSWKDYGTQLEERLPHLHEEVQKVSYRAKPVKRTYITKEDGSLRPLGVTCVEDKLVQQAVSTVLLSVYEADFRGFSYGFRAGRSAHDALDALTTAISRHQVNWILEADIKAFFDTVPHAPLFELLNKRIGDQRLLRLIRKWLKTGYSEDGAIHRTNRGLPQGAVISPVLANIYLHYVLDEWVQEKRKAVNVRVAIVRYADDFVMGFQLKGTAEHYLKEMRKRFREYGLELHPEKTRLIEFGRFAAQNRDKRGEGKPETFDFLGFTHICSRSLKGRFWVKRITARKRQQRTLKRVKAELRRRMHASIASTAQWLNRVLRGYGNYFGVGGNSRALNNIRTILMKEWIKVLRRRSQKGRKLTWEKFNRHINRLILRLRICHPYPEVRFYAKHPRQEPYAVVPHVRICAGGVG